MTNRRFYTDILMGVATCYGRIFHEEGFYNRLGQKRGGVVMNEAVAIITDSENKTEYLLYKRGAVGICRRNPPASDFPTVKRTDFCRGYHPKPLRLSDDGSLVSEC